MRKILAIFLLLCSESGLGQVQDEFHRYRDSFMRYEYLDTAKAGYFLDKSFTIALKDPSEQLLCEYYLLSGWFMQDHSDFYSSLERFKKSAKLARKHNYKQNEADAYGNIANVYEDLGISEKSMEYHQRSLKLAEQILLTEKKDSVVIKKAFSTKSAALGNLSFIYKGLNEYDKAISMMKESMGIDSLMHNYEFLATGFSGLGNIYRNMKDYKKALYATRMCLKIRSQLNEDGDYIKYEGIYQAYHTLGNIHLDMGDLDSAEYFYKISEEYGIKAGDRFHQIYTLQAFGDIAEQRRKMDDVLQYYLQAYKLSVELNSRNKIYYLAHKIATLYFNRKQYKKAFNYLEMSMRYKDSTMNLDKMRELGKAEVNYDFKLKSSLDSMNYQQKISEKEKLRKEDEARHELENSKNRAILIGVISILVIVLIFSVYLIKLYRDKKKANDIIAEQQRITEQHLLIIEEKQKEIVDSINYAKRIQYALLAHKEMLNKFLPDHFVFFKPKDIVSGDFYWFTHIKEKNAEYSYLAVCDSTGHGVPGAFMSLLNISFMNEAINEKRIYQPNEVFNHARERLVQHLSGEGQQDGFDGILLRIDHIKNEWSYAAANNAPVIINGEDSVVLPYDRMPVGKSVKNEPFTLHIIDNDKKGTLYLNTDGYADQFGGERGKKYKFSNLVKYLKTIQSNELKAQSILLEKNFEDWKGSLEQIDDVCLIGIRK